jgi:nitrate reductase gamma subunit
MQSSLMQWLASVGWTAFTWALAGLLLLNAGAVALLIRRRDRHMVQRYTSLWLAGNLLLVTVGVGIPAITAVARLALLGASTVVPEIVVSS